MLRGARQTIAAGQIPVILLEYGDKMSPSIFRAMKRRYSADAAAPSPRELIGGSLYGLQRLASRFGYDAFLIGTLGWRRRTRRGHGRGASSQALQGSTAPQAWKPPVMIPISGPFWHDAYEVCRDKSAKYSPDGYLWANLSVWNPHWEATCWYDVALVHRRPRDPALREALLTRYAKLPRPFCRRLANDRFPPWVFAPPPPPSALCCNHQVQHPKTDVCHQFVACPARPPT